MSYTSRLITLIGLLIFGLLEYKYGEKVLEFYTKMYPYGKPGITSKEIKGAGILFIVISIILIILFTLTEFVPGR